MGSSPKRKTAASKSYRKELLLMRKQAEHKHRQRTDELVRALSELGKTAAKLEESQKQLIAEQSKAIKNAKLASIGEVAAGVAHEINNPLAIIEGTVRFLHKYIGDPEKFKEKTEAIEKAVHRAAFIVASLSKFSRMSKNFELKPHSLKKIVDEALPLVEAKALRYQTSLTFEGSSEALILCEEIEIEQVLINMISNAIDAVRDRNERWVKVTIEESDDNLVLKIQDSGGGIPPSVAERIFEPFFTTKPEGEGTGLGLSIVKGIIDHHGAKIRVLDGPHTCFEIRFVRFKKAENTESEKKKYAA